MVNIAMDIANAYRNIFLGDSQEFSAPLDIAPLDMRKRWVEEYLLADPNYISFAAAKSFNQLRDEIYRQWYFLSNVGFTMDIVEYDPYTTSNGAPNSIKMRRDVLNNRHISVLSTAITGNHPFFSNEDNDLFRAVHDIFGHAATESNFSQLGEEIAYQHHRTMFSKLAIPALTTETRVQNSLNNINGNAFVEQRVTIVNSAEI